ncbi:MAG TPA: DUF3842 family protein [Clostridia bacterium]|nr:DUF3842 family protein [Clostridia bacterium]
MKILLIDAQGGKMGRQLIERIKASFPKAIITAIGTNSIATAAMLKSEPNFAATGENSVVTACRKADVIIGPIAIVIADSLIGEVTPAMSVAVGQSDAVKILIPVNKCGNLVAGTGAETMSELLDDVLLKLSDL